MDSLFIDPTIIPTNDTEEVVNGIINSGASKYTKALSELADHGEAEEYILPFERPSGDATTDVRSGNYATVLNEYISAAAFRNTKPTHNEFDLHTFTRVFKKKLINTFDKLMSPGI